MNSQGEVLFKAVLDKLLNSGPTGTWKNRHPKSVRTCEHHENGLYAMASSAGQPDRTLRLAPEFKIEAQALEQVKC